MLKSNNDHQKFKFFAIPCMTECCEWKLHEKPQASNLLEIGPKVCPRFVVPILSSPTSRSVRVGGVVVVAGSCGGTDSTWASPPSYPVFPLSLNVVNECWKASGHHFVGSGHISLSWEQRATKSSNNYYYYLYHYFYYYNTGEYSLIITREQNKLFSNAVPISQFKGL